MTLYVESNFVLEIALGQVHAAAAESILVFAQAGGDELAVPSGAVFESFTRVIRRGEKRRELKNRVNEEIRDLQRSRPHESDIQGLRPMAGLFADIANHLTLLKNSASKK